MFVKESRDLMIELRRLADVIESHWVIRAGVSHNPIDGCPNLVGGSSQDGVRRRDILPSCHGQLDETQYIRRDISRKIFASLICTFLVCWEDPITLSG